MATCDSGRLVAHVQDTAWHVAEMRVIESERPDALFRDALARKLTGKERISLLVFRREAIS